MGKNDRMMKMALILRAFRWLRNSDLQTAESDDTI